MYKIVFANGVIEDDLKKLSKLETRIIFKLIKKKLLFNPEIFGKPLTGSLKGFYRLRAGIFRVIYKIEKKKIVVLIVKIGLRKDLKVYLEAAKRLGLF